MMRPLRRRGGARGALLSGMIALAVALGASPPVAGQPAEEGPSGLPGDPRSTVLVRLECASDVGRRETTLFANGTVRLRTESAGEEAMRLAEVGPDELAGYVTRLLAEDLSEAAIDRLSLEGEWIEKCLLELPLRHAMAGDETFRFTPYARLPLALSRLLAIVGELGALAEARTGTGLPLDYLPQRGDVLVRHDGTRFRVVGLTRDGKGVELYGLETPVTLYLPHDALGTEFVNVQSEAEPRR